MSSSSFSSSSNKNHYRPHSNTVSAGCPSTPPLAVNTNNLPRRNSEGSPRQLPLAPIQQQQQPDVTTESPKTLSLERHFPDKSMTTIDTNGSEQENTEPIPTSSPAPPIAVPETPVARLLGNRAKSRSRTSSMSFQQDTASAPATAAAAAANGTSYDSDISSQDEAMGNGISQPAPGSIAAACHLEVANEKRNQEFHQLFRSVPENDPLIEDFGCALQKEILLQGRIYISENHLCFNANIFGWVTNLVIAFSDIVDIEKRTTALFIPNAIQVSTLQAKHFFASFLSRDQAYDLLLDVWRQSRPQPDSKSSDDDQEKSSSEQEDDDETMDESDTSSGDYTYIDVEDGVSASSNQDATMEDVQVADNAAQQPSNTADDPVATTKESGDHTPHSKTQCSCDEHYSKTVLETTFPCTLQTLYDLLFEGSFMKSFLQDQKNTDVDIGEWQTGQGSIELVRDVSYTKPLNGAIGPKSTKCLLKEEICHKDLDDFVTEITTTQTPDVPSGGSFSIKTKTCLMWGDNNQTRMLVTVQVEFTKSSWIKSTIESASISGQEEYYKALSETINQKLSESQPKKGQGKKKRVRRKKVKKKRKDADMDTDHESFLGKILSSLSGAFKLVTDHLPTPSTSLISVLCMVLLVILNVYMARKMSLVDHRLESLYDEMQKSIGLEASTQGDHTKKPREDLGSHKKEDDDLWSWLGTIDIEKDPRMAVMEEPSMKHDDDDVSKEYLQDTFLAKEKLDQHMADIEDMIHRASSRIGNVNHVVEFQRQRILQDWSKNSP